MKRFRWMMGTAALGALGLAVACGGGDDSNGGGDDTIDSGGGNDATTSNDATTPDGGASDAGTDSGPKCTATPCVVALGAGGTHTCAVIEDGTVRCWGSNAFGELGSGDPDGGALVNATPTVVTGMTGAKSVAPGGYFQSDLGFTCVDTTSGGVSCFGLNVVGELGRGVDAGPFDKTPAPSLVTDATQVSASYATACAVRTGGAVDCWGYNSFLQLGLADGGSSRDVPTPIEAPAGTTFTQVSVGYLTACALTSDKRVVCWGTPTGGGLGRGDAGSGDVLPGFVEGVSDAVAVSTGVEGACALLSTGAIQCWGLDAHVGGLGRGDVDAGQFDTHAAPIAAPPGVTFKQVASHFVGACALDTTGQVWCWGYNIDGATGIGYVDAGDAASITVQPAIVATPTKVPGLTNVTQIASGGIGMHTCALVEGGSVKCWGLNASAQLGTPVGDSGLPVSVTPVDVHF